MNQTTKVTHILLNQIERAVSEGRPTFIRISVTEYIKQQGEGK